MNTYNVVSGYHKGHQSSFDPGQHQGVHSNDTTGFRIHAQSLDPSQSKTP